jgi:hypothetical protein
MTREATSVDGTTQHAAFPETFPTGKDLRVVRVKARGRKNATAMVKRRVGDVLVFAAQSEYGVELLRPEEAIPRYNLEGRIVERAEAMAAHGRRVGYDQGKRLVKAEGRRALLLAIEVEKTTVSHDAWCSAYVEGLRDALREFDGRLKLSRLDQ